MATQEQLDNIRTDIDWGSLGFSYMPVRSHIRCSYKDGKWNSGVLLQDHTITMTIAATCLHYGQAAFEGLKAFRCRDGKVRVFRPDENAHRLNLSASRISTSSAILSGGLFWTTSTMFRRMVPEDPSTSVRFTSEPARRSGLRPARTMNF